MRGRPQRSFLPSSSWRRIAVLEQSAISVASLAHLPDRARIAPLDPSEPEPPRALRSSVGSERSSSLRYAHGERARSTAGSPSNALLCGSSRGDRRAQAKPARRGPRSETGASPARAARSDVLRAVRGGRGLRAVLPRDHRRGRAVRRRRQAAARVLRGARCGRHPRPSSTLCDYARDGRAARHRRRQAR